MEGRGDLRTKWPHQPVSDGKVEGPLLPVPHLFGEHISHLTEQGRLGNGLGESMLRRNPTGHFDDSAVCERNTQLEGMRHTEVVRNSEQRVMHVYAGLQKRHLMS